MAKTAIKSVDHFFEVLANEMLYADELRAKERFDAKAGLRYDNEIEPHQNKVIDYTDRTQLNYDDNTFIVLNAMRRIDDMAHNETADLSKAAFMMGMKNVAERHFKETTYIKSFALLEDSIDYVESLGKYEIPASVKSGYRQRCREISRASNMAVDTSKISLEEHPHVHRVNALCTGLRAFYDSTAFTRDVNGDPIITRGISQLFEEAAENGRQLLDAATGIGKYKPANDTEKEQISFLKGICKDFHIVDKSYFYGVERSYADPKVFLAEQFTINPTSVTLRLEKSFILSDMTEQDFSDKVKLGHLSRSEKEWGEANIDRMLEQLYSTDELKALKEANVEPCMGIFVDGKSCLDLPTGTMLDIDGVETTETFRMKFGDAQPTREQLAELKCAITVAALDGKALDVNKFIENENGEIRRSEKTVPVQTRNDMDKEPVSIWRKILRLLGIDKSSPDRVMEGNSDEKHTNTNREIREKIDLNELMGSTTRRTTAPAEHQPAREHTNEK